ncbi:hypothetical protein [Pollutibacter soli]|uniref:hypothetical protein n=1 Tax=Pollutibacter soli TaxID=3034157 RepID=UPI0030141BA6
MKRVLCILFFCSCAPFLNAQTDSVTLASNIRTAADSMLQSFRDQDFIGFVKYNNTNLVAMMGGENEFASYLRQEMDALKGVEFSQMKAGSVIRLITKASPMQCVVEQFSELKINGQPVSSVSHLVGVSSDGGKTWRFADANTASEEEIKSIIPNLSPLIVIPKKQQKSGVDLTTLLKSYRPVY